MLTGLQTPEGSLDMDVVTKAWKSDNKDVISLKAIPHVTRAVVKPNGFEKMKVNFAFTLFSKSSRACTTTTMRSKLWGDGSSSATSGACRS